LFVKETQTKNCCGTVLDGLQPQSVQLRYVQTLGFEPAIPRYGDQPLNRSNKQTVGRGVTRVGFVSEDGGFSRILQILFLMIHFRLE
jgi:hypothetical protein